MNRREMFATIAGIVGASGVKAETIDLSTVDLEPSKPPAMIVVETTEMLTSEQMERLKRMLCYTVDETAFAECRVVVLDRGMKLSVLAADGTVLNRSLAEV